MRLFQLIGFLFIASTFTAQIPNPDFELWTSAFFYEDPENYSTNNLDALISGSPLPVLQVDGENDGAVRIISYNDRGIMINGFVANGDLGTLTGGAPFEGRPDSVFIDYRASFNVGDTAAIGLFFKNNGDIIGSAFISLFTSQVNYHTSAVALPDFAQEPDTLLVFILASAVDTPSTYSNLDVDAIRFDHGYEIINHDFDDWEAAISQEPDGWTTRNFLNGILKAPLFVSMTDDSYSGSLALQLRTEEYSDLQATPGVVSGILISGPEAPGRIYKAIDFEPNRLTGYYKYESTEPDSAMVVALFFKYDASGDSLITFGPFLEFLEREDEYVSFSMDLDLPSRPDSFIVAFAADYEEVLGSEPDLGRTLFLDDLSFDISTDLDVTLNFEVTVFPNPVLEYVNIHGLSKYEHNPEVTIYDQFGRAMINRKLSATQSYSQLDLRDLSKGTYFLGLEVEGRRYFKKLIKN